VVPNAGSSKAFDRYNYGYNNPINYNDPSGHQGCRDDGECYLRTGDRLPSQSKNLSDTINTHYYSNVVTVSSIRKPTAIPFPLFNPKDALKNTESTLNKNPIKNTTSNGNRSDSQINAMFEYVDKIILPIMKTTEMEEIYTATSKGGYRMFKWTLPTGIIETGIAGLRQAYKDSLVDDYSSAQRGGRALLVALEAYSTDYVSGIAGDIGLASFSVAGPGGSIAGYAGFSIIVSNLIEHYFNDIYNPSYMTVLGSWK
jgi:hypothetical protein